MRKTHEPKAALKALLAAVGVSAMVMTTTPAHAGPLGFLKKAAEKELKKTAEARLQAEAERHGIAKLVQAGTTVATASEVQAPTSQQAEAEHEITYDIAAGALHGEATDRDHKDWIIIQSMSSPMLKMSQNGTTVATASEVNAGQSSRSSFKGGVRVATGDINGDGTMDIIVGPGLCALVQNGTTVATADEILSMTQEGSRWSRTLDRAEIDGACEMAGLSQNGTTVATANEILAPDSEVLVALLLPAVQGNRLAARPARAGMSQNGTTVETANTILGPDGNPVLVRAGYIWFDGVDGESKMSQNGHSTVETADTVTSKPQRTNFGLLLDGSGSGAEPDRAGMSQNGTTVPTADTVTAPDSEPQAASPYLKIGDIKGEANAAKAGEFSVKSENSTNIGSSTGGAGGAGKVKFDRLSIKK